MILFIMMTDILEAATRLRRNHTVEGSGLAHSYGVIQDCRIYLFGEEPPAEPIARNKTRISARDMLEAIRFDKRLYLHTDLKQILKKQLDFVESPKPKKRKNTMEGEGPPAKNKPHP
ncbi:hypothetical protein L596_014655 [Steinernema carpocapsae]|uniref:Uncharacterized protein n=1 Tax=Steinernema carpocapsae TaxID=34508 RepID=A0A4U5ND16_STECR|nr:hypothetical protein L596_014655 [Steinernema carpocapsae]